MINVKVVGLKELNRKLMRLERKVATKVARTATTKATRPLRNAVKSVTPGPTGWGAMKKSMSQRVRQYPAHGVFTGIVGPDRNAQYEAGYKTPWGIDVRRTAIPDKYLHLVLQGHRKVVGGTLSYRQSKAGGGRKTTRTARDSTRTGKGRIVGEVAGNDFLSRGMKRGDSQALRVFIVELTNGVTQAWNAGT